MAHIEFIQFDPLREFLDAGSVLWKPDHLARAIPNLPQIFWSTGDGWAEANLWALDRATQTTGSDIKRYKNHYLAHETLGRLRRLVGN